MENKLKIKPKTVVKSSLYSLVLRLIDTTYKSKGATIGECFFNLNVPPVRVARGELKITKGKVTHSRYLHIKQMRRLFHGIKDTGRVTVYQQLLGKHLESWFV